MASRFPQIIKNFRRGSTEGVSGTMFLLAIGGNVFYATSILLSKNESENWSEYITSHLPWLIGSLGTVVLDVTLFLQCLWLDRNRSGYQTVDQADDDLLED